MNILAQVEAEKAHLQQDDKNVVMAQFWEWLASALWKMGKNYLKRRYCIEEEEVIAMLQELTGDGAAVASKQGMAQELGNNDNAGDGDDKGYTELRIIFNALKKAEAKVGEMDGTSGDTAVAEKAKKIKKWWAKVKHWFVKKLRKIVRKYLC